MLKSSKHRKERLLWNLFSSNKVIREREYLWCTMTDLNMEEYNYFNIEKQPRIA